jgi:hypothetical protein
MVAVVQPALVVNWPPDAATVTVTALATGVGTPLEFSTVMVGSVFNPKPD